MNQPSSEYRQLYQIETYGIDGDAKACRAANQYRSIFFFFYHTDIVGDNPIYEVN